MLKRFALVATIFVLATPAALAQSRCRIMDPTGTPLNIRETPNGRVVGTIRNGVLVSRAEQVDDARGRSWVFIHSRDSGAPLGWVFREFVACF